MALRVSTEFKGFAVPTAYIRINHIMGGKVEGWHGVASMYKDAVTAAKSVVSGSVAEPTTPEEARRAQHEARLMQAEERKNVLEQVNIHVPYVDGGHPYILLYGALKARLATQLGQAPEDV
jgi:hypothetical protein